MKKHFYSHLVKLESITIKLDEVDLSDKEKEHLISIIHSSLHSSIIDIVLSELSEEDKKNFLTRLAKDDHVKIWEFLESRVEDIEEKIKKTASDLVLKFHKDIDQVKEEKY